MDNGGVLDRVHFVSQVRHPEDAEFLQTIIESNPARYTYRDFGVMNEFGDYRGLWDHDIEPDTIYVKIGPRYPRRKENDGADCRRRRGVHRR